MPRLAQRQLSLALDEAVAAVYATWTEDMLLNNVRGQALTLRYLFYHTRYSLKSAAGFPDCVLVGGPDGDRLIFAELKRQGKWPTEGRFSKGIIPKWVTGQWEWLKALDQAKTEVYLLWPSDVHDISTILLNGPSPDMECVKRTAALLREGKPDATRSRKAQGEQPGVPGSKQAAPERTAEGVLREPPTGIVRPHEGLATARAVDVQGHTVRKRREQEG